MRRTQIYLPEQTYEEMREWAREESKSMAEKIREVLDQRLKRHKPKKKKKHFLEALSELQFKGGPKDLSVNHDKYLYGEKNPCF